MSNAMPGTATEREHLVRLFAAAAFIIFFQAYMVAPIIPVLSIAFGTSVHRVGLIVPAYLIPYGIAGLVYGLLADRFGFHRVMFASLAAFAVLTPLTATAQSVEQLALWRMLTGLGAAGIVPLANVVVGSLFPYERRGRPLGWLFGAVAGGMAFGSPLGALVVPTIGWRGLFLVGGFAGLVPLLLFFRYRATVAGAVEPVAGTFGDLFRGYRGLLATPRARRTYGYVFVNSIFHSGVFTWLGVYFERRYGVGPVAIGLMLVGYGVPGFLFGPVIGRAADRWGRARLLPIGLGLSAFAATLLILDFPVILGPIIVLVLSLGYAMTQPLLAGIVTSLGGYRPGQAMGLNAFALFVGFGLGSLIFGEVLHLGFVAALGTFSVVEFAAALLARALFRSEVPSRIAVRVPKVS
jgi:predicted MFS family arabinose efflux permease